MQVFGCGYGVCVLVKRDQNHLNTCEFRLLFNLFSSQRNQEMCAISRTLTTASLDAFILAMAAVLLSITHPRLRDTLILRRAIKLVAVALMMDCNDKGITFVWKGTGHWHICLECWFCKDHGWVGLIFEVWSRVFSVIYCAHKRVRKETTFNIQNHLLFLQSYSSPPNKYA